MYTYRKHFKGTKKWDCQNEIVEGQKCVKSVKIEMKTMLGMQLMSFEFQQNVLDFIRLGLNCLKIGYLGCAALGLDQDFKFS